MRISVSKYSQRYFSYIHIFVLKTIIRLHDEQLRLTTGAQELYSANPVSF